MVCELEDLYKTIQKEVQVQPSRLLVIFETKFKLEH